MYIAELYIKIIFKGACVHAHHRFICNLVKRRLSLVSGSTKTRISSTYTQQKAHHYMILVSVRNILYEDIKFNKEDVLGKGTFGKCFKGKLAHFDVCIKVIRNGADYQTTLSTEATLSSHCCHPNLPWLYAIAQKPYSIIISSLHTINN